MTRAGLQSDLTPDKVLQNLERSAAAVYETGERLFETSRKELERTRWGSYVVTNTEDGSYVVAPSLSEARNC
jgi:hypothetical protein